MFCPLPSAALCESSVYPTPSDAPKVLELADAVAAYHLKEATFTYILQHLDSVIGTPGYRAMARRNPNLQNALLTRIRGRNEAYYGLLDDAELAVELGKEEEDFKDPAPFPWVPVIALIMFATVYGIVGDRNVAMSNVVPAMNIVLLVVMLIFGAKAMQT